LRWPWQKRDDEAERVAQEAFVQRLRELI